MTYNDLPVVWNIAGSDSFGAAGAQTDLKTITMHNCHACQVITAITAQTPSQCQSVYVLPPQQLEAQLAAIGEGPRPNAVKIGMIGSRDNLAIIKTMLSSYPMPLVLDPVINSSSGHALAGDITPQEYFELCSANEVFLTPNISEAEALAGMVIKSTKDLAAAAKILLARGASQVLLKGGHFNHLNEHQGRAIDFYCDRSGLSFFIKSPRKNLNMRGTGCILASSLAANLALGQEPADAVVLAKAYLNQCLSRCETGDLVSISKHAPFELQHSIFPEVELGEELSGDIFEKSPKHETGFYAIGDNSKWVANLVA